MSYKIIGFQNHNVLLKFDGKKMNFVLPISDGKYPEGEELDTLLNTYVENTRNSQPLIATNESVILSLVEEDIPTAQEVRQKRNALLFQSDWYLHEDSNINKSAALIYRQALRDITAQIGFPENVEWPTKPV